MKTKNLILILIISIFPTSLFAVNCQITAEQRVKSLNPWAKKIKATLVSSLDFNKGKLATGGQVFKIDMTWRDNGKYIPAGNYKGVYLVTFHNNIIKNKCILTQLQYLGYNRI